jgi:hypothetical protein
MQRIDGARCGHDWSADGAANDNELECGAVGDSEMFSSRDVLCLSLVISRSGEDGEEGLRRVVRADVCLPCLSSIHDVAAVHTCTHGSE